MLICLFPKGARRQDFKATFFSLVSVWYWNIDFIWCIFLHFHMAPGAAVSDHLHIISSSHITSCSSSGTSPLLQLFSRKLLWQTLTSTHSPLPKSRCFHRGHQRSSSAHTHSECTKELHDKMLFHSRTCSDTMQTTRPHMLRRCWIIRVRSAELQSCSVIQSVETLDHWGCTLVLLHAASEWVTGISQCVWSQTATVALMTHLFRTINVCVETLISRWELMTRWLVVAQWWKWLWIFRAKNNRFPDVIGGMNLISLLLRLQPAELEILLLLSHGLFF